MKNIVEYFVIKKDESNSLWQKYIKWLNKTYKSTLNNNFLYYGHNKIGNSDVCIMTNDLNVLPNNPTLMTLEFWNKIINQK